MKRLAHPELSQTIDFEENITNTLVIENKNFFRKLIADLMIQFEGGDGELVLSGAYEPIDIARNIEVISQFVPFEINKKILLNKLCTAVEKTAMNEENYAATQALLADIERYLDTLLFDLPYEFEYEKLNASALIKAFGIALNEAYEDDLEKIMDYMQLVRELDRDKIFVFINMRSYYADETMELFVKEAQSRKFHLLLIDNTEYNRLSGERRLIIDADLCEIF